MSEAAVIPPSRTGRQLRAVVGSVLIIDDEAAIRESLETLLEMEGYEREIRGQRRGGPDRDRGTAL